MADRRSFLAPHERVKASRKQTLDNRAQMLPRQKGPITNNGGHQDRHRTGSARGLLDDSALSDIGIQTLQPTKLHRGEASDQEEPSRHLLRATLANRDGQHPAPRTSSRLTAAKAEMEEVAGRDDAGSTAGQYGSSDEDKDDLDEMDDALDLLSMPSTTSTYPSEGQHLGAANVTQDLQAHLTAIPKAKDALDVEARSEIVCQLAEGLEVPLTTIALTASAQSTSQQIKYLASDSEMTPCKEASGKAQSGSPKPSNCALPSTHFSEGNEGVIHACQIDPTTTKEEMYNVAEAYRLELEELREEYLTMKNELSVILIDGVFVNKACGWCVSLRDLLARKVFPGIHD